MPSANAQLYKWNPIYTDANAGTGAARTAGTIFSHAMDTLGNSLKPMLSEAIHEKDKLDAEAARQKAMAARKAAMRRSARRIGGGRKKKSTYTGIKLPAQQKSNENILNDFKSALKGKNIDKGKEYKVSDAAKKLMDEHIAGGAQTLMAQNSKITNGGEKFTGYNQQPDVVLENAMSTDNVEKEKATKYNNVYNSLSNSNLSDEQLSNAMSSVKKNLDKEYPTLKNTKPIENSIPLSNDILSGNTYYEHTSGKSNLNEDNFNKALVTSMNQELTTNKNNDVVSKNNFEKLDYHNNNKQTINLGGKETQINDTSSFGSKGLDENGIISALNFVAKKTDNEKNMPTIMQTLSTKLNSSDPKQVEDAKNTIQEVIKKAKESGWKYNKNKNQGTTNNANNIGQSVTNNLSSYTSVDLGDSLNQIKTLTGNIAKITSENKILLNEKIRRDLVNTKDPLSKAIKYIVASKNAIMRSDINKKKELLNSVKTTLGNIANDIYMSTTSKDINEISKKSAKDILKRYIELKDAANKFGFSTDNIVKKYNAMRQALKPVLNAKNDYSLDNMVNKSDIMVVKNLRPKYKPSRDFKDEFIKSFGEDSKGNTDVPWYTNEQGTAEIKNIKTFYDDAYNKGYGGLLTKLKKLSPSMVGIFNNKSITGFWDGAGHASNDFLNRVSKHFIENPDPEKVIEEIAVHPNQAYASGLIDKGIVDVLKKQKDNSIKKRILRYYYSAGR